MTIAVRSVTVGSGELQFGQSGSRGRAGDRRSVGGRSIGHDYLTITKAMRMLPLLFTPNIAGVLVLAQGDELWCGNRRVWNRPGLRSKGRPAPDSSIARGVEV